MFRQRPGRWPAVSQARAQEFLKGRGWSNFGLLGYFRHKLIGTPGGERPGFF